MKVLFVHSVSWNYKSKNQPIEEMESMQLGISYISSVLKSKGHNTQLFVLTDHTQNSDIDFHIRDFNPSLICFTAVYTEYPLIKSFAAYVKNRYPNIYLLIGGSQPSLEPEVTIDGPFDALCIGEGEYPVLELVEQLEENKAPSGIQNLWIKTAFTVEKNPSRPFIADIDSLPFPDRDLWKKWAIEKAEEKQVILLGRGCPFLCTYCSNHALRKLSDGNYVRFRSAQNVIDEMKQLVSEYPKTRQIYFEVETIGADMKFSFELCNLLKQFNNEVRNDIYYGVNLRIVPSKDYTELFASFKEANFDFINIGLESGSNRVRQEILKRHYSNEDIRRTVETAKKCGIKINVNVLVGLPGETKEDFNETIECLRECQPDESRLSIFYPYPGTDLYELCKKMGILQDKLNTAMERRKAVLDMPGFSKREIQNEYDWFSYKIANNKKNSFMLLLKVLHQKFLSNYFLYTSTRNLRNSEYFRRFRSALQAVATI